MHPSYAVVMLQLAYRDTPLAVGTGVFYRRHGKVYIATAWHNVTGRHAETLAPLSSTGAIPDRVTIHFSSLLMESGRLRGVSPRHVDVPLEEDQRTFYLTHPQGFPRVDVVALPIDPTFPYPTRWALSDGTHPIMEIPMEVAEQEGSLGLGIVCIQDVAGGAGKFDVDFEANLGVSDDLFIVGYPTGLHDQTRQPIWKRATVASDPQLGWDNQRKFLVDCASRHGMSGAPVITYSRSGRLQVGGTTYMGSGPAVVLHGIYVNRVGGTSEFEAQIGSVWKREMIDEIIDAGQWAIHSRDLVVGNVDIRELVAAEWPSHEGNNFADDILNKGGPSGYFSYRLAEKLGGGASFDQVDRIVREEAARRLAASGGDRAEDE